MVLFFSFEHGRLLPDEVCNVRLQLLAAQSGGEGPEFSSNASFIRLRQANTTPERSLERSDLSATSLRTYLDSYGRSEPQRKQNSTAKPDRNPVCWSSCKLQLLSREIIKMRGGGGGICDAILTF